MKEWAVAILLIPVISLSVYITPAPIRDGYHQIPDTGAGWLEQTAWVTDPAWRVVLGGHTPGDFERLNELRPGDLVIIIIESGPVRYHVTERLFVTPGLESYDYLAPTPIHTLTLITCVPNQTLRLIVNAERE